MPHWAPDRHERGPFGTGVIVIGKPGTDDCWKFPGFKKDSRVTVTINFKKVGTREADSNGTVSVCFEFFKGKVSVDGGRRVPVRPRHDDADLVGLSSRNRHRDVRGLFNN